MLIELGGRPATREKRCHLLMGLLQGRTAADEAETFEDPELVTVDHQHGLAERAEVQSRGGDLPSDTGQHLEPGESLTDGHVIERRQRSGALGPGPPPPSRLAM